MLEEMFKQLYEIDSEFPNTMEQKIQDTLLNYFGELKDITINFLTKGSKFIVFELKKNDKNYVIKIGKSHIDYASIKHKKLIESLIFERLDDEYVFEMQEKVKIYNSSKELKDDGLSSDDFGKIILALISSGIVVDSLDDIRMSCGKSEDGNFVFLDKASLLTKEELDKISPTYWDEICCKVIYKRDKRKIGECFGPGSIDRRVKELKEANLFHPKDNPRKGGRRKSIEH